ncbi:MAG: BrnA antitoxin family protein [Burkholderiaceae bacterium]|nr:BrnA antitoxin family protein [Burkholderiaceae bacterium]
MTTQTKIEDTAEAWDSGRLGNDEQFVRRASAEAEAELDDALGLQAISIRLPKDLIEQFKLLAKIHGMGYQPLMREALKRFAAAEVKVILTQLANEGRTLPLEASKNKVDVELSPGPRQAA